jgi:hypothetical protein
VDLPVDVAEGAKNPKRVSRLRKEPAEKDWRALKRSPTPWKLPALRRRSTVVRKTAKP